jgi:hypothetical protein
MEDKPDMARRRHERDEKCVRSFRMKSGKEWIELYFQPSLTQCTYTYIFKKVELGINGRKTLNWILKK